MLKISSRHFIGLLLITSYLILASNRVDALRCYQCVHGSEYICPENEYFPVTCPSDSDKCALIYTTVNFDRAEWRGCVNTTIDATLNANLTAFGDQLLGSYANATDYQTCSKDLCNAPLKCYFCTAGEQSTCKNDDIGGDECLLEATNCATVTFGDKTVWKGCLTSEQVSAYSAYSNKADLFTSLKQDYNVTGGANSSTSTDFSSCTTSLCNTGNSLSSFGIFLNVFVPLLFTILLVLINQ